jgi:hypothetical protein
MRARARHEGLSVSDRRRLGPRPLEDRHFVSREAFIAALEDLPPLDYEEFQADADALIDPTPRDWFEG